MNLVLAELSLLCGVIFGAAGGYAIGWNRGCGFMEKRWAESIAARTPRRSA